MTLPRVLVAGIGNIFLGDDAFGVEVVHRLASRPLPDDVRVVDFGIRSLDLAYTLAEGIELVILVDALPRGGAPGTLYVLEPELNGEAFSGELALDGHTMHPLKVLHTVRALGGELREVRIVGCEPACLDPDSEMQMGLSEPVQAALDGAVELVESLIRAHLGMKIAQS
jgi:hydrogenase maturation protease